MIRARWIVALALRTSHRVPDDHRGRDDQQDGDQR